MKDYRVFLNNHLKQKLTQPMFAREYCIPLRCALELPALVMDAGWRQGFNPELDPDRGFDARYKPLYAGGTSCDIFCGAFQSASRATFVLSLRCESIDVDIIFSRGSKVLYQFWASFDKEGGGGITGEVSVPGELLTA